MKRFIDPASVSRIVVILLIGFLFFYMFYGMIRFDGGQSDRRTASIAEIIEKALVHCYALEGAYPAEVEYVERYGVIFDNDKYFYYYEWYGSNLRPSVVVVER